jgi:hypothetical protein
MKRVQLGLLLLAVMFFIGLAPERSSARIVVGISSVNVAFLPLYVTLDRGFSKTKDWTFFRSCSTPAIPIFRR